MIEMFLSGEQSNYEIDEHILKCGVCGYEFVLINMHEDGEFWNDEAPNFCPDCGSWNKPSEEGKQDG